MYHTHHRRGACDGSLRDHRELHEVGAQGRLLRDLLVGALPLHLLLGPAHPARAQLLEVVHRALHTLHHREGLQVL